MPLLLQRYFLKRWTWPFLGALFFYGGLLLANETVGITKLIFSQGATLRWVVPFLLTTLPETLAMVLPMAAVLGGLMGTQTLVESSEWVASQGLGAGSRALLRPWAFMAVVIILLGSFNAHCLVPLASRVQDRLKVGMAEEVRTRFLRPGAPPWFPPGAPNQAIWMAPDGRIHWLEVKTESVQHLVASHLTWGREDQVGKDASILLRLDDLQGAVVQKTAGRVVQIQQKNQIVKFEVPSATKLIPPTALRYLPSRDLLKLRQSDPEAWVELGRRLSLPFAGATLLLLGIALGLGHPRFQKGGAILKSLAVIIGYWVAFKWLENQYLSSPTHSPLPLFLPPIVCGGLGLLLFVRRLRPQRSGGKAPMAAFGAWVLESAKDLASPRLRQFLHCWSRVFKAKARSEMPPRGDQKRVLRRWTEALWLKNWGATLGTFLVLNLLIEFATRAADMREHGVSTLRFLEYWVLNLPPFLAIVLPLAFLLGTVLTLSEAAATREWVAIRAGGGSLLQWMRAGSRAWGGVLVFTFLLQVFLAPWCVGPQDKIYRQIVGRPERSTQSKPWLYLGGSHMVWFLDGERRWGFPLVPPGQDAVILDWSLHSSRAQALPWGGLGFEAGPKSEALFPSKALREYATAEETPTHELYEWQRWAPDPERASLLWQRLLTWLAGPCLVVGMLGAAFPSPRAGRGQVLGLALVAGLLFLGLQGFFFGAARAGEVPPFWGALAPLVLFLGVGLARINRLKT